MTEWMSRYSLTSECGAAGVQRITETEVRDILGEKVENDLY